MDCPWQRYEAEDAKNTASVHGPSREYLTPESESSGRRYVRLDETGEYLEITSRAQANTLVVRYSLPDAPTGGGIDATLSLYINGKFNRKLELNSRHAWVYGDFPWSTDPAKGRAHRFFDESHFIITPLSPGDVLQLRKETSDTALYYLVDFIELEQIAPPMPRPENSLSIIDCGAAPGDGTDDSAALSACIAAAKIQKKTVWIPPGKFTLSRERFPVGGVTIQGAGMWYSILSGTSPMFEGTGESLRVSDLAIFGETDYRNDTSPDNAFNGNLGDGSVFKNLWIEHVKCGFWTTQGTRNMLLYGSRIRNVMADGLNFCDGTSYSTVEQCHFRNTGDDAIASWSPNGSWSSRKPCVQNSFLHNTIELPWHANGIAVYGGTDHVIANNEIRETVYSGAGILISSGFESVPFSGKIRVETNVIAGVGGDCYIGEPVGGLWIHAKDSDIDAEISVDHLKINNSAQSGITVHGPKRINNMTLNAIAIDGAPAYGIHIYKNVSGSATWTCSHLSNIGSMDVSNQSSNLFHIVM
jgi:hypothetical protein